MPLDTIPTGLQPDPTSDRAFLVSAQAFVDRTLVDGGPEVSWGALCAYAADRLNPTDRRQIEQWIATYRGWYDAFWELVADLDADGGEDRVV